MQFIRTGPFLIFGVVIGIFNFIRTEQFRKKTGQSPWRIHPVIWGLASVPISVVITVLAFVAILTSKPKRPAAGALPYGQYGTPAPGSWSPAPETGFAGMQPAGFQGGSSGISWSPAPETAFSGMQAPGAGGMAPLAATVSAAPIPAVSTGAAASAVSASPAGWHRDPTGRNEHRYWDGTRWSHHVSNAGNPGTDQIT